MVRKNNGSKVYCNGEDSFRAEGQTYEDFMVEVDNWLISKVGMGYMDFADFDSYAAWMDGMSPGEAGKECLAGDSTGIQMLQLLEEGSE